MTQDGQTTAVQKAEPALNGDAERGSLALIVIEDIDSDLIIQELQGRAIEAWAYAFDQDGTRVSGLTVAGVEQCSRESAKQGEALRIMGQPDWRWVEQDAAWFAVVTVGRYAVRQNGDSVLLDTAIGTKLERQRKYSKKLKRYYDNPNALDVAISKAARNAKRKLLDPLLQKRVLEAALGGGKVVQVDRVRQQTAVSEAKRDSLPPPSAEKVAEDQARATFYQAATDAGIERADIHLHLQNAIGLLACPRGKRHDVPPSHPEACHALREAVEGYAASTGPDKAAAWRYLTDLLGDGDEDEVQYGPKPGPVSIDTIPTHKQQAAYEADEDAARAGPMLHEKRIYVEAPNDAETTTTTASTGGVQGSPARVPSRSPGQQASDRRVDDSAETQTEASTPEPVHERDPWPQLWASVEEIGEGLMHPDAAFVFRTAQVRDMAQLHEQQRSLSARSKAKGGKNPREVADLLGDLLLRVSRAWVPARAEPGQGTLA